MMFKNLTLNRLMLGRLLICFLLFFFLGCEESKEAEKVDLMFGEDSSCLSSLDSITINRCKQCSYNEDFYLTFELFLNYYFKHFDDSFSLDDDLVIYMFPANEGYFMYSKNKKVNRVWSSVCGVYENLSPEQMERLNSIENKVRNVTQEVPSKNGTRISLFVWKGKSNKYGSLKDRFEFFPGNEEIRGVDNMYNFFAKEVFVHGCKKHLLLTF